MAGTKPFSAGSGHWGMLSKQKVNKFSLSIVGLAMAISVAMAGMGIVRSAAPESQGVVGCTFEIPSDVLEVNGKTNYADVKPGDILCLPAGERGNLKLMNLNGVEGMPITVINSGGTVVITGTDFLTGGIGIYSSSYLRITGTGMNNRCGAQYTTADQQCGIVIHGTRKGIKFETGDGPGDLSHLEIDHISISNTSQDVKTRGLAIHPKEGQLITGLYIHHNYIGQTLAEGIYMGTEPRGRSYEVMGKIEDMQISYNLVEQTGYDGIKVKVGVKNITIHHNVVRETGLTNTPAYQGGIKMAMSTGEIYNNVVENVYEGIRTGRPKENAAVRVFNNVVVNSRRVGIEVKEAGAMIFNNTVVWCGEKGITGDAASAQVFDNIIAGCEGNSIKVVFKAFNLVGPVEKMRFLDPAQNNFRLQPTSPAVDAGHLRPGLPAFDFDDYARLQGANPDMGAFEYR